MGRNAGYGQRPTTRVKSKINWIEYDINWFAMAKSNCPKCYGRGYEGFEVQTEDEIANNDEKTKLLCDCVAKKWTTMSDEERLTYATRKENADEIVIKAKEELQRVIEEEKEKVA